MYLSQALAIKILPKLSQAKVIVEGSKHQNGRWETVCRCDQSWAPGSKSPNIETWQNSHQPGTVTLKHNLIFDACCKLLSFIQHKAPGCNFSLHRNISAWDAPFYDSPIMRRQCPGNTDLDINTRYLDNAQILATTPHNSSWGFVSGPCRDQLPARKWFSSLSEGGRQKGLYLQHIHQDDTARIFAMCFETVSSQIWSRGAGVWWVCKHIFPGDQEINQREMCNFRLKLLLILMDPIKQTVGGMECCRDKCNRRFLFYDGLESGAS